MLYPVPAVMVSCARPSERPNIITVAWTGTVCSNPAMVSISVRPQRYSYNIIRETGEFVINLTTEKLVRATDYCGVRSGRGDDLARVSHEPIQSVYFVPNMRSWLIESDLYPFIGGDGIRVKEQIRSSPSLPSVNSILPYQFPSFMKGASMEAFYNLSVVCLENARSIFLVLEKLYQDKYGRKLTMSRIGEVLAEPRHPDTCILDTSVVQESPSLLLTREMQKLHRLKHLLDGEFRM